MRKSLIFLGIESSCDETAASIVRENQDGSIDILSNIVSSQIKEHKPFWWCRSRISCKISC